MVCSSADHVGISRCFARGHKFCSSEKSSAEVVSYRVTYPRLSGRDSLRCSRRPVDFPDLLVLRLLCDSTSSDGGNLHSFPEEVSPFSLSDHGWRSELFHGYRYRENI